jgi:hypothetical protein
MSQRPHLTPSDLTLGHHYYDLMSLQQYLPSRISWCLKGLIYCTRYAQISYFRKVWCIIIISRLTYFFNSLDLFVVLQISSSLLSEVLLWDCNDAIFPIDSKCSPIPKNQIFGQLLASIIMTVLLQAMCCWCYSEVPSDT